MIVQQPFPAGHAGQARRAMTAAIGVSIAAHVALVGYLAVQRFQAPPTEPAPVEDPGFIVQLYTPDTKPVPQTKPELHLRETPVPINRPDLSLAAPPTQTPDKAVESTPPTTIAQTTTKVIEVPQAPPVITSPTWLRKPGAREFARFYPDSAMRRNIEGGATLACLVGGRRRRQRLPGGGRKSRQRRLWPGGPQARPLFPHEPPDPRRPACGRRHRAHPDPVQPGGLGPLSSPVYGGGKFSSSWAGPAPARRYS